ncbi:MAG: D-alanyl-D-alanine carboxypeptidase/D-alanyl-D-alanine-endopeptidase [Planctomycetota bacterium]
MLKTFPTLVLLLSALPILSVCAQTPTPGAGVPGPAVDTVHGSHHAAALDATQLAAALDNLLNTHDTAKRTNVTLVVRDLETGDTLYNRGGDKLLTPASNLKIYTAAAAIDLLRPDYTWTTGITLPTFRGSPDVPPNQAAILVATGDPMFDTEQFNALVDQLEPEQLRETPIVAVGMSSPKRWRDVPLKGPGWMWDDDPDYYNMSIRAGMLNFNVVEVSVTPDGDAFDIEVIREPFRRSTAAGFEMMLGTETPNHVRVTLDPPAAYPVVPRHGSSAEMSFGLVGPGSKLFDFNDRYPFSITRKPFEDDLTITGFMKPDAEPVYARLTVHDPAEWIPAVMADRLETQGMPIQLEHDTIQYFNSDSFREQLVAEQQGKPLSEAVQHFLRVSENAVGEMLLLHLAEKFDEDGEVSWPAGAKVISDWLVNEAGVEEGSFRLVDGSGLSRYNLISANSSIELLDHMDDHEHFAVFFDGLPVYKVALPEQERWSGVPLAEFEVERVFAKPGGMSGVNTISGYLDTLDGRRLAFSLLANGYIGSSAPVRDLRGRVWSTLVRYRAGDAE